MKENLKIILAFLKLLGRNTIYFTFLLVCFLVSMFIVVFICILFFGLFLKTPIAVFLGGIFGMVIYLCIFATFIQFKEQRNR